MRRAAHPSGRARCGAGAGCSAIEIPFSLPPEKPIHTVRFADRSVYFCGTNYEFLGNNPCYQPTISASFLVVIEAHSADSIRQNVFID